MKWGALWGTAFGFWIVAPIFLRSLRMRAEGFLPWLEIDVSLVVFFATLGSILSLIVFGPWAVWRVLRRAQGDDSWTFALVTPAILPAAYVSLSIALEWFRLGAVTGATPYRPLLLPAAVVNVVAAGILLRLNRRYVMTRSSSSRFARSVLAASAIGIVARPYTSSSHVALARDMEPATQAERSAPNLTRVSAPLLFVGIDGANWPTLLPLIESGRTPTLARLVRSGIHGEIEAPWPPYWSTPARAAIVTGFPREETNVYADLAAKLPGLPYFQGPPTTDLLFDPLLAIAYSLVRHGWLEIVHYPRSALRRPPFWELLTRAGVKTAVVRLPFTFPAEGQADVVVSDWAGRDEWSLLDEAARESSPALVYPPAQRDELLAFFSTEVAPPAQAFERTAPAADRPPHDFVAIDPREALRRAVDIDERTLDAAEYLVSSRPDLSVVAVYAGGFDTICHAFWPYRFPSHYADPPVPADVENFGPVIDRYLEYLDEHLGRIIARFSKPPNVIIVSDHGFAADLTRPLWKAWHAERGGVFIAAGPSIPGRSARIPVRYFDVAPTVMDVLGYSDFRTGYGESILRSSS